MTTPAQYIAALAEPKRGDVKRLDALIRRTVPAFEPFVMGTMLGYGRYAYRYASGREGETARIALSANKGGISIYVLAMDGTQTLVEKAKARLGKAAAGKSCIRVKSLADFPLDVFEDILVQARSAAAMGEPTAKAAAEKKKKPKKR